MIPNRVDISERPEIVELRARLGDWEDDTVFGQNAHLVTLVTLVDRKSRLTLIKKVPNKKSETVAECMISLLIQVLGVKTVTLDNSGNFAKHCVVSAAINADIYFAKSYARNTNGIIRRHWPKKMPIGALTDRDIYNMEVVINSMPKKVLGGLIPIEIYTEESAALIV